MKQLLIILTILIGLDSCDPCRDCGNPLVYDPTVLATFINQDSLLVVEDSIDSISSLKTSYTSLKSTYTTRTRSAGDSINKYQDSVDDGKTEYQTLVDLYKARQKVYSDSSKIIDTLNAKLNEKSTILGKIKTIITSGKIKVDTIKLLENGRYLTFPDSTNKYSLSLLIDANETSYEIKIKETTLHVSFTYTTEEYVDEVQRLIKIRANDVVPTSPDSIQYLENEGRIIFYF